MLLGTLQVDHVDVGELGGLSDRAGGWNTVPRRSALPCGLLPGPEWSHLQLLQSRSGECPTAQAKSWQPGIGPLGLAIGVGQAQVLRFISLSCFPGPAAVCAEPASGPTLPGRWPLCSWLLLHPHCLGDLQLLPVLRGEGAVRSVEKLGSAFTLFLHSPTLPGKWASVTKALLCPIGCVMWGWPPLLPPGLPLQR